LMVTARRYRSVFPIDAILPESIANVIFQGFL